MSKTLVAIAIGLLSHNVTAAPSASGPIADRLTENQRRFLDIACALDAANDGELAQVATLIRNTVSLANVITTLRALRPELGRGQVLRKLAHPRFGRPNRTVLPSKQKNLSPNLLLQHSYALTNVGSDNNGPIQLWSQVWIDDAEQDDRDNIDGFDARSRGLTFGLDRTFGRLGLGAQVATSTGTTESDLFGEDDVDSIEFGVNANWSIDDHLLSASITYTDSELDRLRVIAIPTQTELRLFRLTSTIDSTQWAATVGWSGHWEIGDAWAVAPFTAFSYAQLETDDYLEQGAGNLSLGVATDDEQQSVGTIGASLSYLSGRGNWLISPSITFAYEHDFKADATQTQSRFLGTNFRFASRGYSITENRVRVSAGLQLANLNGWGFSLSLETQRKDDYAYNAAIIGVQFDL